MSLLNKKNFVMYLTSMAVLGASASHFATAREAGADLSLDQNDRSVVTANEPLTLSSRTERCDSAEPDTCAVLARELAKAVVVDLAIEAVKAGVNAVAREVADHVREQNAGDQNLVGHANRNAYVRHPETGTAPDETFDY